MKILITGGNNAKALKLMKAFPGHFVLLADYGDVPGIITENYAFSSLGTLNQDSIAHILLNFCITEAIDCIIPLHRYEVEPMAKSAVLFGEYGIQVLLPDADGITDYLSGEKNLFSIFAVYIHGDCIYTSGEHAAAEKLPVSFNGVFGYNNVEDLKLLRFNMDAYQYVQDKQAVIFELDNVLFPEKDYLLQVYYLFAQFIEYSEQKGAQPIIAFMQAEYENNGPEGLFEKTANQFGIDEKYQYNFDLLHQNARLPLKLLLYKNMLEFMQELVVNRKQIFIVTAGNPAQQLNKIKQTEWNGLEKYLTVFFTAELNQSKVEIFQNILNSNNLSADLALVVGANKFDEQQSRLINLPYIESLEIYK